MLEEMRQHSNVTLLEGTGKARLEDWRGLGMDCVEGDVEADDTGTDTEDSS